MSHFGAFESLKYQIVLEPKIYLWGAGGLTVECSAIEMSEINDGSPTFYYTVRQYLREKHLGRVIMYF